MSDTITVTNQPLAACLKDFARRFEGRNYAAQRKRISEFVGCSHDSSVIYWLSGKYQPHGTSFWKTVVFFHLIGYRVEEFEQLRMEYQKAVILMGAGMVSPEELAEVFGYESKQQVSQLLVVLRNNSQLSADKMTAIRTYVDDNASTVVEVKKQVQTDYRDVLLATQLTEVVPRAAPPEPAGQPEATPDVVAGLSPEVTIAVLADLIKAALPLAQWLESDAATEDMRAQLRERSGRAADGVFRLGNLLNRLCGERARQSLRQQQGQK